MVGQIIENNLVRLVDILRINKQCHGSTANSPKEKFKEAMQISNQGVSNIDFKNVPSLFQLKILTLFSTDLTQKVGAEARCLNDS